MSLVTNAQFITGVVGEDAILHDGVPQIAFVGRSNVGKSSTMNAILGRTSLVKTGRTPGKTREINFFSVTTNDGLVRYFVDLPGYGYAKVSKLERKKLEDLITWYLSLEEGGPDLVCVVLDAKVGLTDLDREFSKIAIDQGRLLLVLVNKLDKINQKAQAALKRSLQGELGTEVTIFYYSAKTGKHLNIINNYLFGGEDPQEVLS